MSTESQLRQGSSSSATTLQLDLCLVQPNSVTSKVFDTIVSLQIKLYTYTQVNKLLQNIDIQESKMYEFTLICMQKFPNNL